MAKLNLIAQKMVTAGHTQYWNFNNPDTQAFKAALADIGKMLKANEKDLADWDGEGKPTVKPDEVAFNGKAEQAHETFRVKIGDRRGFTKTNKKPYDAFVSAALLILKHHLGDGIDIDSDAGNFKNGKKIAQKFLSKSRSSSKEIKMEIVVTFQAVGGSKRLAVKGEFTDVNEAAKWLDAKKKSLEKKL